MKELRGIHRQHYEETDPGWQVATTVSSSRAKLAACQTVTDRAADRVRQHSASEEMHAATRAAS